MKDYVLEFLIQDIFDRQAAIAEALNIIADQIDARRHEQASDGQLYRVPVCVLPPTFWERLKEQEAQRDAERAGQPVGPVDPTIVGR